MYSLFLVQFPTASVYEMSRWFETESFCILMRTLLFLSVHWVDTMCCCSGCFAINRSQLFWGEPMWIQSRNHMPPPFMDNRPLSPSLSPSIRVEREWSMGSVSSLSTLHHQFYYNQKSMHFSFLWTILVHWAYIFCVNLMHVFPGWVCLLFLFCWSLDPLIHAHYGSDDHLCWDQMHWNLVSLPISVWWFL